MGPTVELLSRAIKRADSRLFFTNYKRQAEAALEALDKAGFVVLPKNLTYEMLEAGRESLRFGTHKPSNVLAIMYDAVVKVGAVKE
jgi:hypothetical protein